MEYDELRPSGNIDDRRGQRRMPGGRGGLGIGTIVVLGLLGWALGINPLTLIEGAQMVSGGGGGMTQTQQPGRQGAPNDEMGNFVSRILGETEDVWSQVLPQQANINYRKPTLVLYSGATRSACGSAQSAMGPFYCPNDQKVYLDTAFFQDMQRRMGGGGNFAYAYVIAHEIGHHVENLLGILSKAQAAQQQVSPHRANAISVRIELMADCLAGVWANKMNERHANITQSDLQQAVNTASAIGDDRLQRQSRGVAVPDSFTHGSSAQRVEWLTKGLKGGQVAACNTFNQPID
jgi:uncharacterized protein